LINFQNTDACLQITAIHAAPLCEKQFTTTYNCTATVCKTIDIFVHFNFQNSNQLPTIFLSPSQVGAGSATLEEQHEFLNTQESLRRVVQQRRQQGAQ